MNMHGRKPPVFSIIMPVFNAKKYVAETIDSILRQTLTDFELIIIDDGSSDGSGETCEAYSQKDERIVLIRQANQGLCTARNRGLKTARGRYIAFCDHDDLYEPQYLARAIIAADAANADVVKFPYRVENWNYGKLSFSSCSEWPVGTYDVEDLMHDYKLLNLYERAIWNGIYKRAFLEQSGIQFDPGFRYGMEDFLFNILLLEKNPVIVSISNMLYTHFNRTGQSASVVFAEERLKDILRVAKREEEMLVENSVPDEMWMNHETQYLTLFMTTLTNPECPFSKKEKQAVLAEFREGLMTRRKVHLSSFFRFASNKRLNALKWILLHLGARPVLLAWKGSTRY